MNPKVHIDDELKSLIPPLTDDEYTELEQSLIADGCRDAIIVWRTKGKPEAKNNVTMDTFVDVIIDGHNRYEICQRRDIHFEIYPMWLDTKDEVKLWIIKNQFARRNIDKVQRSRLALTMKNIMAAEAKERQKRKPVNSVPKKSAEQDYTDGETREKLAEIAGVSHDTIHKVETVDRTAPEPIMQAMTDNVISINQAYEATKVINNLPEHDREVIVEKIVAAPKDEQKDFIKEIQNGYKNSPEKRQSDIQHSIISLWTKILLLNESNEMYEAWFSEMSEDMLDDQEDAMERSICKVQGMLAKFRAIRQQRRRLEVIK